MILSNAMRPEISRNDMQRLGRWTAEAASMPIDSQSRRHLQRIARRLDELHHQALGHPQNPLARQRECPQGVCLHQYRRQPSRMNESATLAHQAADRLDSATFSYRWRSNQDPKTAERLSQLYNSRRPHLATKLRASANRVQSSFSKISARADTGQQEFYK